VGKDRGVGTKRREKKNFEGRAKDEVKKGKKILKRNT